MANLPTLYEHYTAGGISNGLSVDQPHFTLNNRNFSIYSGSMHYFRVPSEYWRDRMRKMRAAGLNTLDTYVPWNLHEPSPENYDFGNGGTDMEDFLDIAKYIRTAQEEDLFVIMRPGPFICAEFEFGGFPSWLLREPDIKVRTSDEKYMKHVRRYFNVLLTLLASFQFMRGGPIIAFQVENEYGSTQDFDSDPPFTPDLVYVEQLRQLMLANNITELLFTSDSPSVFGSIGSLPILFQTANFDSNPEDQFRALVEIQGNKPIMATEYWCGWFDHWAESHHEGDVSAFTEVYETILKYPASVNLYMFHGGTSWGFLNGANKKYLSQSSLQPDVTSYDYDAPLMENGDYNPKYFVAKKLLEKYNKIKTKLPEMPPAPKLKAFPTISIQKYLSYEDIVAQLPYSIKNKKLLSMESLPINNETGQSFGYILYRKQGVTINKESVLRINGYVHDHVNVYINNELVSRNILDLSDFGYWKQESSTLFFSPNQTIKNATLDLVVENLGRCNYGKLQQMREFKGLWQEVFLDNSEILNWEILPMEFKKSWIKNLKNWHLYNADNIATFETGLYKADFNLEDLSDTYIDMSRWRKGFVIVNNFVLGRHWKVGPQQALYLPAPLLKKGTNEIIIFEEFSPENEIFFSNSSIYFNSF